MCRPGECGWARAIMHAPPPSLPGRGVRGAAVSSQRRRGKRSGWHLRRARVEGTCRGHAAQRGATARRAWGEQSHACGEAKRTDMHRGGGSWSGRSVANQRPVHRIGVAAHHPIIFVSSDQRRGQLVAWNHSANVPGTPSRHNMPRPTRRAGRALGGAQPASVPPRPRPTRAPAPAPARWPCAGPRRSVPGRLKRIEFDRRTRFVWTVDVEVALPGKRRGTAIGGHVENRRPAHSARKKCSARRSAPYRRRRR